jgi:hypothetical protein
MSAIGYLFVPDTTYTVDVSGVRRSTRFPLRLDTRSRISGSRE